MTPEEHAQALHEQGHISHNAMRFVAAAIHAGRLDLEVERYVLRIVCNGAYARMHTLIRRLADAGLYGLPEDLQGGPNPDVLMALRDVLTRAGIDVAGSLASRGD